MGKRHLLPSGNEEFLDRLGLTEIDQQVYIAILDGGLVSAGEVQQLTQTRDLGNILESIRDLTDLGLVKKAKGMMPRYYASLPFFRETLSVEREFKFALDSMLQSLKQSKESTEKKEKRIRSVTFPKVVNKLLDRYYEELFVPVLQQFEEFNQKIQDESQVYAKAINDEIQKINQEISLMLQPLKNYSELLSQKFDLSISSEEGELLQYTVQRKKQRLDSLEAAHRALGDCMDRIEKRNFGINSKLKSNIGQVSSHLSSTSTPFQTLDQLEKDIRIETQEIQSSQDDIHSKMLTAREKIKRLLPSTVSSSHSDQIDEIFEQLTNKVTTTVINTQPLLTAIDQAKEILTETRQGWEEKIHELEDDLKELLDKDKEEIIKLKNEMGSVLNTINQDDDDSLQLLRQTLKERLEDLRSNIVAEGKGIKIKMNEHFHQLDQDREQSHTMWKEKMIDHYQKPVGITNSFMENWVEQIQPIISDFKQEAEEALAEVLDPILILGNETFSALSERISFVMAMVEARASDLQKIMEMAQSFDYTKTSDTWVVVGLPAIYASLTDLLLRSKSKVTVVTPHLDLELVDVAQSMRSSIRITFVADIDPEKDARLIKKLDEIDRIHLRSYPERDLYACIRDAEEIIFGYIHEGEETVGIRASTPSVVRLLEDRLNETVIRNSKQI